MSLGAVIIALLSGYPVVAYVAGRDMTRSQIVIVSTLYVLLSILALMPILAFAMRAMELMQFAVSLSNRPLSGPRPNLIQALLVVWLFALAASLEFMWDIRHKAQEQWPRTEQRADFRLAARLRAGLGPGRRRGIQRAICAAGSALRGAPVRGGRGLPVPVVSCECQEE